MKLIIKKIVIFSMFLFSGAIAAVGQNESGVEEYSSEILKRLNNKTSENELLIYLDDLSAIIVRSELPLRDAISLHKELETFFAAQPRLKKIKYMLNILGIAIAQNQRDTLTFNKLLSQSHEMLAADDMLTERIHFNLELAQLLSETGEITKGFLAQQLVEQLVREKGFERLEPNGKLFATISANNNGLFFLKNAKYDSAEFYFREGIKRAKVIKSAVW